MAVSEVRCRHDGFSSSFGTLTLFSQSKVLFFDVSALLTRNPNSSECDLWHSRLATRLFGKNSGRSTATELRLAGECTAVSEIFQVTPEAIGLKDLD
jgi:hypothetical protein